MGSGAAPWRPHASLGPHYLGRQTYSHSPRLRRLHQGCELPSEALRRAEALVEEGEDTPAPGHDGTPVLLPTQALPWPQSLRIFLTLLPIRKQLIM